MRRLVYIDSFSIGTFHEMFNASSLKMFSEIYEEVRYYTSNSVKENTFKILGKQPQNVIFSPIPIININNRIGSFLRQFLPVLTNSFILFKSHKNDVIFINYNSLWSFGIVNLLAKFLNRSVIIMCHGELEGLIKDVPHNFLSKKFLKKFNSKTFLPAKHVYFCVLGQSIKNNLYKYSPTRITDKVLSFEHSYIFNSNVKNTDRNNKKIIKIGAVGSIRPEKGLNNLIKLGKLFKEFPNFMIYALGRIYCDTNLLYNSGITYIPEADCRFLSRDELDTAIRELDYIVFLYPRSGYKLTASGALYDAIDNEKLILTLKNDYFDAVLSRCPEIGLSFDNVEDIATYLVNKNRLSDIPNYLKIKEQLGVKTIAKQFKNDLKVIGFLDAT
jgi:glycosyltransferase involved in cell wall biosynthesis